MSKQMPAMWMTAAEEADGQLDSIANKLADIVQEKVATKAEMAKANGAKAALDKATQAIDNTNRIIEACQPKAD